VRGGVAAGRSRGRGREKVCADAATHTHAAHAALHARRLDDG